MGRSLSPGAGVLGTSEGGCEVTTLYRTPNVVIDEFEFHMTVEVRKGRVGRHTRWRLLSTKPLAWQLIAHFKGHPPKPGIFKDAFRPYLPHVLIAEKSVAENRAKAVALQKVAV